VQVGPNAEVARGGGGQAGDALVTRADHGWLPLAYPNDPTMRISHETIYLSLYVRRRGALAGELRRCLRTGRAIRHPRGKRLPQGRGQLIDTVSIRQRPAEANGRSVPGHLEGDLLLGKRPRRC
jgi:IS30 family transposase